MSTSNHTPPQQLNGLNQFIALAVTAATFSLYFLTLAPTVLEADSGEFQFVAWLPAIAHPTGYPLYTLLGWLWTHLLPWGEVAWRMNLFSAASTALAVGLTYLLMGHWLAHIFPETPAQAQRLTALFTAFTLAVSPTLWSQAIIAEVYGLHLLLLVATVYGLVRQQAMTVPIALLFGLGLSHHITTILWLPTILVCCAMSNTPLRPQLRAGLAAFIPLSLYLYLPLIAPVTPYATLHLSPEQTLTLYDNTWTGFLQHITATVFTQELQPTAVGLARLTLVATWLQQQVGWSGLLLMVAGLITLYRREQKSILALTGLGTLAVIAFNLSYFIGDVYVLFIPVWWVACLWLGIGSLGLWHHLTQTFVRRRTTANTNIHFRDFEKHLVNRMYELLMVSGIGLLLLLPLSHLITHYAEITQAHNTAARDRWQQILAEPIPERALLLSNDRNEIMPMWYYQYVMGQRPDLQGLFPLITPDPVHANVGRLLEQALLSARPVYLIKPMPGLEIKANLTPVGTLFQATAYTKNPSYPQTIPFSQTLQLTGYDVTLTPTLVITLYWQVLQPLAIDYTSYIHLVDLSGAAITQSDHQPGGDFYPSHYWQTGERLYDRHELTLPAQLPAAPYQIHVGWYYQPMPGQFEKLGQNEIIGNIDLGITSP